MKLCESRGAGVTGASLLTVADAVAYHARSRPDALAFICGAEALSFAEFDDRATRVAHGLRAAGIAPGARVAFLGKNSNAYMEAAIGTVRAANVFTPINWRLAPPEVSFMLQDSAATAVFADEEYTAMIDALASELPLLLTRLCVDATDPPPGWVGYGTWRDAQPTVPIAHVALPADLALQIYTSGTTGRPKGVMLTHRNLRSLPGLEAPIGWPEWNRWRPDDVSLLTLPLFHVGGIGWTIRGLFPGSTQVILREFSASVVLDAIGRHRVTRLPLVPSAMGMVLQLPEVATTDFSSVDYIYYGTSPIPLELLRESIRVFGCGFVQSYGQTETSSAITALSPEDHTLEDVPHMRSAGKALPGVELEIRDESDLRLPAGAIGEIVTRSSSNMAGYANMPADTAITVSADGWLRTGDAGYMDEQGFVYVKDRIKEMIITGGENVYPAEVENALYGHPSVADVAVIGVPSAKWGQAVHAVVVLRPGQHATHAELISWAREFIGGYKLPKSIDFMDALPRNGTGKVIKGELRKRYAQAQSQPDSEG